METITNIISHSLDSKRYFNSKNICFMDIETTGLNRNNNTIYLIGVLYFDYKINNWILNQYFANTLDKERKLLESFIDSISIFDKIVTFNGESFDLPFIEHRLKRYNINYKFNRSKSFDLYQIVKKNRYYLDLPDLKLKTIERSLGFFREDKYSGYDCIGFYYDYVKSKNIKLKENVLKHNYDDLVHMLDIIQILDVLDNNKSFYIPLQNNTIKFTIENIEIKGDMITIKGFKDLPLQNNIRHYDDDYSIITEDLNRFTVSMEFKRGYVTKEQQCIYVDCLENIWILTIEKNYCIDNIKNLLKKIFENIF